MSALADKTHPHVVAEDCSLQWKTEGSAHAPRSKHSQRTPCSAVRWATHRHPSNNSFTHRSWRWEIFPVLVPKVLDKPPLVLPSWDAVGGRRAPHAAWLSADVVTELAEGSGALLRPCPPLSDRSVVALLSSLWGPLRPCHPRTAVFQKSMGCWRS